MDLGPQSAADLLERALGGEPAADEATLALVGVANAVAALDQRGLAPRADFVSDLRGRLLTIELPANDVHVADNGSGPGRRESASVVELAARPLRLVAAAAAVLFVLAGLVGVASRGAAPGDALYPVKQLLDRTAIQFAGSRFDEGMTHLAQAEQHIGEARDLIDRGGSGVDVSTAFDAASDSLTSARRILQEVYRTEQRPEALTALSDFITRALPQVDALGERVPAGAESAYQRLRTLLGSVNLDAQRQLASCTTCGSRADAARKALETLTASGAVRTGIAPAPGATATGTPIPGSGATTGAGATSGAPGQPAASIGGSVPLPGGGLGLPSVKVTSGTVGAGGGGLTLPSATAQLPSVGVSSSGIGAGGGGVTLPGSTISLPTLGATSTGVTLGGGGVALPGPLPTTTLPTVTLSVPPLPPLLP